MADQDPSLQDAGALFQIAEPGQSDSDNNERRSGFGIGIDLGTTHSVVAWGPNCAAKPLLDEQERAILPSVVAYTGDGPPVVGYEAQALASKHPGKVIASAKRFLGRKVEDIDFPHPYRVGAPEDLVTFEVGRKRPVNPIEVSAEVLKTLKNRAEAQMGESVDGAVVTVPAYFNEAQRQATKDACRLAGLKLYRLLAEPTAAALAYGLNKKEKGLFAVYDLGGGTFDVSILRLRDGVFQVLATGGDTALGGDDFDRAIAALLFERAQVSSPTAQQTQSTLSWARKAKEDLSTRDAVELRIPELELEQTCLTRDELDTAIEPWIKKSIRVCRQTLKDAGLGAEELDDVVLVGGSTRVPKVQSSVARFFGRAPHASLDADLAVALGAAEQADLLSGTPREGMTLLDVSPLSLGLETMGGMVEVIIPRNATLPIAARQTFTNYSEAQTAMKINVVQGERELARDCRSVAAFQLSGLPALPPGLARVEVTFELDADGLLTVSATELTTQSSMRVQVVPSYGLEKQEIEALVTESLQHAQADFEARNIAEARVELGRVVEAVQRSVKENGHNPELLPEAEKVPLLSHLEACAALLAESRPELSDLRQALRDLERASEPFARRRMESALRTQMSGKAVDALSQALHQEDQASLDRKRGGHAASLIAPEEPSP